MQRIIGNFLLTRLFFSSDEDAAFEALSAMRKASASMRISKIPQAGPSSPTVPESSTNPGISPSKPQLKPVAVSSAEPSHRRCFDKKKQRFYYVDLVSGESKWRAPSEGIVLCT